MAKQTWVNVDGAWKKVKNVWIKVNGVWKQKSIPKGRIAGVWKEFQSYGNFVYVYHNSAVSIPIYSISPDGSVVKLIQSEKLNVTHLAVDDHNNVYQYSYDQNDQYGKGNKHIKKYTENFQSLLKETSLDPFNQMIISNLVVVNEKLYYIEQYVPGGGRSLFCYDGNNPPQNIRSVTASILAGRDYFLYAAEYLNSSSSITKIDTRTNEVVNIRQNYTNVCDITCLKNGLLGVLNLEASRTYVQCWDHDFSAKIWQVQLSDPSFRGKKCIADTEDSIYVISSNSIPNVYKIDNQKQEALFYQCEPLDIAVSKEGDVYVLDSNYDVSKLDKNGTLIWKKPRINNHIFTSISI